MSVFIQLSGKSPFCLSKKKAHFELSEQQEVTEREEHSSKKHLHPIAQSPHPRNGTILIDDASQNNSLIVCTMNPNLS